MQKDILDSKNNDFEKNIINFNIISIILITIVFMLSVVLQQPIKKKLCSENAIFIGNEDIKNKTRDFSYYIKDKDDELMESFTTVVSKSDIENIGEDNLSIYTPMIQSEAFEIYINDELIAIEGDVKSYNSSVWTKSYYYTVSKSVFNEDKNIIKIVQYSRYMGGGSGIQLIIDGHKGSEALRNLYMIDIHQGIAGTALGLIFLLLLLMVLLPRERKRYILMFASLGLMLIGYLSCFELNMVFFDFLTYKKIVITSNLLAVGTSTVLVRRLYNKKKHPLKIILFYSLIIIIPTLFAGDMRTYKIIYTFFSVAIIPIFAYLCILSIKHIKKYPIAKVVISMSVVTAIYIIASDVFNIISPILPSSTIVSLPLYIILIIILILIDIYELKMNIAASNIQYKKAYKDSITDGLTDVYNAGFIQKTINEKKEPYTMVIIDIDDFKKINDKFGHAAGDLALIELANTIKYVVRDKDYVCRYGGDEFVIIIDTERLEIAKKVLERILLNY